MEIKNLRRQIDLVNLQILKLLAERGTLVHLGRNEPPV